MPRDSFTAFVLDQLSDLPGIRARSMFGGTGLYAGDRFFGILAEGRLYFKTDATSRGDYVRRGMSPFVYAKARRTVALRYFEVPADVLEDRHELARWAQRAASADDKVPPRARREVGIDEVGTST